MSNVLAVIVVGYNDSGKSSVGTYISQRLDFQYIELGELVRRAIARDATLPRDTCDANEVLVQRFGFGYLTDWVLDEIRTFPQEDSLGTVIVGIRNYLSYVSLREAFSNSTTVAIVASAEIRYLRDIEKRRSQAKSHRDHLNWNAFVRRDARHRGWGLDQIVAAADISIDNNSTDPSELFRLCDDLVLPWIYRNLAT